jgi:C1A family cysteine protease
MPQDMDASQLNTLIKAANASWVAGTTSVSELPPLQQQNHLGYNPAGGEESLEQRIAVSASRIGAIAAGAIGAPAAFDWRNVGGQNYITPVTDQKYCGSCVAFGTTAAVEGTFRVQRGNPGLAIDLSEASLFFCNGPAGGAGACPGGGWYMTPAMDAFKTTGVPDEACFPYTDGQQQLPCSNRCSDWQNRAVKITGWHTVSGADIKTWLSTRGPLATCFTVYNDFFSYKSGTYKHVSGGVAGGHCVCCIGYSDAGGFWICKNSWGAGWGESGYFCIAYGECGIDSTMWAVEGIAETGWLNNTRVIGLWTIDQDRNAWAYLNGIGWRRIAWDNDNILIDLLRLLAAAKEGGRPVNVYQDNGVIKQIYVL